MEFTEKIEHLADWVSIRADIRANDFSKWSGNMHNQLPSFEYYIKNCVIDKGGKYDFTKRTYGNNGAVLESINYPKIEFEVRAVKDFSIEKRVRYSNWMGTPFNIKIEYKITD